MKLKKELGLPAVSMTGFETRSARKSRPSSTTCTNLPGRSCAPSAENMMLTTRLGFLCQQLYEDGWTQN